MKLIDIGCNLCSKSLLNNYQEIIREANNNGVSEIIITGSDKFSNEKGLELSLLEENLYSTVGFHPHHANDWKTSFIPAHLVLLQHKKILAVGETGLDYFRNFALAANQKKCFIEQIAIASEIQKPLFLHERNAFSDFRRILETNRAKFTNAVWHCFTGDKYQLEWAISQDFYIGITGWIADPSRGKNLREIVKFIPENKLLIETDAPYLAPKNIIPTPKINKPEYLSEVLKMIAKCREEDENILAEKIYKNTKLFFNF
ncbi:MAG: TatD family hydrolase [Cardiobacteriaceae bacterium]|nr:TatD family hydrolase [Cardiobacteriaceae bacterium]